MTEFAAPGTRLARAMAETPGLPIARCYVAAGAAPELAAFAKEHCGSACLVVADERTRAAAAEPVMKALADMGKAATEHVLTGEQVDATGALGDAVAEAGGDADFFVGIGSGTVCDLVKHAGTRNERPVLLFATAASMNGYTSGITAVKVRGLKRTVPCRPALGVFADPEVVASAPPRMVAAGVADFLSKCSAGADWRAANLLRGEYYDENALRFYEGILEPVLDCSERIGKGDPEAIGVILEALMLSGLSMLAAGSSSPASGGEHLISHYIDMKEALYGTPNDLHGVQVGVGAIHCLRLWEKVLALDPSAIDPDALVAQQPTDEQVREWAIADWGDEVAEEVLAQWREKSLPRDLMRAEIMGCRDRLPEIAESVRRDLLPSRVVERAIQQAGGPAKPEDMNAPIEEYRNALKFARFIRSRFTILDLAAELGVE